MPCLHCRIESVDPVAMEAVVDPHFILERASWATGPRLAPDGHEFGRICGVCGVLFYPPKPKPPVMPPPPRKVTMNPPLPPLKLHDDRSAAELDADGDGRFPDESVYRSLVEGRLVPLMDGTYVALDDGPFRVEKLVLPSDATAATLQALRDCGYEPLDPEATIVPGAPVRRLPCPRCGDTGRGEGGRLCGLCRHGRCARCGNPLGWSEREGKFCLLCPEDSALASSKKEE